MDQDELQETPQRAKSLALGEPKSRELGLVITKIEEAMMWRDRDLDTKHFAAASKAG